MGRFAFTMATGVLVGFGVAFVSAVFALLAPPFGIAIGMFVVVGALYFVVSLVLCVFALTWLGVSRLAYAVGAAGRRAVELRPRIDVRAHVARAHRPTFHWHRPHTSH